MMKRKAILEFEAIRMRDKMVLHVDAELKTVVGEHADKAGVPLNEYVAKVLAAHVRRPALGKIPRKSFGRPRKDLATA